MNVLYSSLLNEKDFPSAPNLIVATFPSSMPIVLATIVIFVEELFAVVMFLVFDISQSTLGPALADVR